LYIVKRDDKNDPLIIPDAYLLVTLVDIPVRPVVVIQDFKKATNPPDGLFEREHIRKRIEEIGNYYYPDRAEIPDHSNGLVPYGFALVPYLADGSLFYFLAPKDKVGTNVWQVILPPFYQEMFNGGDDGRIPIGGSVVYCSGCNGSCWLVSTPLPDFPLKYCRGNCSDGCTIHW
jgi:hypothetical protein